MNSQIGFNPAIAAPIARPVNPCSEIGVSKTLLDPNLSKSPWVTLYAPSYSATSSPNKKTSSSNSISSAMALLRASLIVISISLQFLLSVTWLLNIEDIFTEVD